MSSDHLKRWRETRPKGATEVEQRNPYQKWRDKDTRTTVIGAQCVRCTGTDDPAHPAQGYRSDIKSCSDLTCPLRHWRPYR